MYAVTYRYIVRNDKSTLLNTFLYGKEIKSSGILPGLCFEKDVRKAVETLILAASLPAVHVYVFTY